MVSEELIPDLLEGSANRGGRRAGTVEALFQEGHSALCGLGGNDLAMLSTGEWYCQYSAP